MKIIRYFTKKMENGLKSKDPYLVSALFFFLLSLFFKPLLFFYIGLSLISGLALSRKNDLLISFLNGLVFLFLHILVVNVFQIPVIDLFVFNIGEIIAFIIILIRKRPKIVLPDKYFLCLISFFSFLLIFKEVYFNFSDALYHFSFLRDIIRLDRFSNFDPFYGKDFYDIRYSYSFYIPFLSIPYITLIKLGKSINQATSIILDSSSIFLYLISSFSVYYASKRYFGIISARISAFLFTVVFLFVKSNQYRGVGFSLSAYPMALCVYFMFPLLFYILKLKEKRNIIFYSFLLSGIHIFYWGLFFIIPLIEFFIKRSKSKLNSLLLYLLSGVPVLILKFYNGMSINNDFFTETLNVNRFQNFLYSGIGIPTLFPLISLLMIMCFFNIYRKRKLFLYLTFFAFFISFFVPEIIRFVKVNPQKLKRIYQLFPVFFIISPALTFFVRKNKKFIRPILIIIFTAGIFHFIFIQQGLSVYSQVPQRIVNGFESMPKESLIVSTPMDSMLIAGLTSCDVVSVPVEYSAPSVDDLKRREDAIYTTILKGDNEFEADYALIPIRGEPVLMEAISKRKDMVKIGGSYWLVDLKK